jgi:aryl-alcohol dehydrogenase-like predicted oxidoreductase
VHVRSIFLNGVLLSRPEDLTGRLQPLASSVGRIRSAALEAGCTPLDLAVAFAREVTGADAVVIGAYTADQLDAILTSWLRPAPASGDRWGALAVEDSDAVDPRTWRR